MLPTSRYHGQHGGTEIMSREIEVCRSLVHLDIFRMTGSTQAGTLAIFGLHFGNNNRDIVLNHGGMTWLRVQQCSDIVLKTKQSPKPTDTGPSCAGIRTQGRVAILQSSGTIITYPLRNEGVLGSEPADDLLVPFTRRSDETHLRRYNSGGLF